MRRRKRLLWLIPLTLAGVAGALSFRPGVYLPAHRHCIKMAGLSLDAYADLHGGRFPEHPNGYGNALMLVETGESASELTGPGYDPKALDAAKAVGREFSEEECGRVYVQGLTKQSSSEIAILFDKLSTPGGDHCHLPLRLWAARGREVLLRGSYHIFVRDSEWPAFAAAQVELLVKEGIARQEAERLYAQVTP